MPCRRSSAGSVGSPAATVASSTPSSVVTRIAPIYGHANREWTNP
jgi:hypothetical protein